MKFPLDLNRAPQGWSRQDMRTPARTFSSPPSLWSLQPPKNRANRDTRTHLERMKWEQVGNSAEKKGVSSVVGLSSDAAQNH